MTHIVAREPASLEPVPQLDATEARQAVAPHRLRYMLGFSMLGVIVAFAVIYFAFVH